MHTTLLLSTFTHLLKIVLDRDFNLVNVDTLHTGKGIYFGLTRGNDKIYIVARNLTEEKEKIDPKLGVNNIDNLVINSGLEKMILTKGVSLGHDLDLHQIRYHDGLIWMVAGAPPELRVINPESGKYIASMSLADMMPPELQHSPPKEHPRDRFHFNSLHFSTNKLFILANNWRYGSYAVELKHSDVSTLFTSPQINKIYLNLGYASHDLFYDGSQLFTLDGEGQAIVTSKREKCEVGSDSDKQRLYLRGMAADDNFFYVSYGIFSEERSQRLVGITGITIINRQTFNVIKKVEIGNYGNSCDLLLISDADLTDN